MKMKNLDLNKYGVQEMNAAEMRETEGGFLWLLEAIAIGVLVDAILSGSASIDSLKKGYQSTNRYN